MNEAARVKRRPESLLSFGKPNRLPFIRQSEVAECGLACLGMIAGFYGYDIDLINLRKKFSLSGKGVDLRSLMNMASQLNLAPRALRVEMDQLGHLQLPCILHWSFNHFVVLKALRRNRIVLFDPAFGERSVSVNEFNRSFTGIALELNPTKEFEKKSEKESLSLSQFWSSIVGLKRSLAQILLLSLMLQVFALIAPFYLQTVVDDVLLRKDIPLLVVLAMGFGLVLVIQVGAKVLREKIILQISNRLGMQMYANLFRHLIRLPMDFFIKRHMGDVVSRFGSLANIRDLLTHGLVSAVIDGIMATITLVAMFFYNSTLTFIVLLVVALYAITRIIFYAPFRTLTEESLAATAKESTHFMESVRAVQTIKIFQREALRQHQWQNYLASSMNKNIQLANWKIGYDTINDVLFGIENIIIIYFAAMAVMGDLMSLGMLYAFMSYKGHFISAVVSLINRLVDLKMLNIHLGRLSDITFTETESNDGLIGATSKAEDTTFETSMDKFSKPEKIAVSNLSYRYSEHEDFVFRGLSFEVEAGKTTAIIGPSGCGKTTLLKCLMGLLQPAEGDVLIDDRSISKISNYRSRIAAVMQDDQLLSGDIIENISCFSESPDIDFVYDCAQRACVHNDIVNMPMGYHTLVGDMGSSLSGGQKQRVVLARALYRNPHILFMDEATSHLDVENEMEVNSRIQQLNITRIIVAHRPETIRSADKIIDIRKI